MTKKKFYITLSILSALAATLLALLIYFISASNTYRIQLENGYRRSFYELSNNLQSIELDLSKLVATNNASTQRDILSQIYQLTNVANGNLSTLPITNDKIKNVNRYLNTLGGYAYSLLNQVNDGMTINKDQFENITWLHESSKIANYDIASYINTKQFDGMIIDNVRYDNGSISQFDAGLSNVNSTSSTVPTLIYDGPFSDSVINKEIKGIKGDIISESAAHDIVSDVFSYLDKYTITYVGDTEGKFATYNYNLVADNYTLNVQITKVGGFILSVNNYNDVYIAPKIDVDSAQTLAENYLKLMGIDNIRCVWVQKIDNIVYFNMAYYVDDVIYYPDLIKVKVDLGLAKVTGMDATNYAYNHYDRNNYTVNISEDQAEAKLNPILTVDGVKKCVIPNKYVGESSAYEFKCTWDDYTYFIYLSTLDGKELNIVRLVDTTSGDLAQ